MIDHLWTREEIPLLTFLPADGGNHELHVKKPKRMGSRSCQGLAGGYLYEAKNATCSTKFSHQLFNNAIHNTGRVKDRVFIYYIGGMTDKDIRQTLLDSGF